MFSNLSFNSISLAMVTPSLVTVGLPILSRTTFLPFGPSVTLTVLATLSTPRSKACRACSSNMICLDVILIPPYLGHDVFELNQQVFLSLNLQLFAAIAPVNYAVAFLQRQLFSIFERAHG